MANGVKMGLDILYNGGGFRAGSYSGYNQWRNQLANLVGTTDKRIWENPVPGPFVELINFSDCEGTIDSKTSAKLAKDFQEYQGEANIKDEHFVQIYNHFRIAFECASDGGSVVFC